MKDFSLIKGDIRNLDVCLRACEGVDYVLHQAAWGSVPRSIEMPLLYEEINIRGTLNMLEAARQCSVKRFIYASSSSVYGDEPTLPKVEGREGNLLSPYAFTKRAMKNTQSSIRGCMAWIQSVSDTSTYLAAGRILIGYYAAVIPKFIQTLLRDEVPSINGDGLHSRDFTYIDNIIEINLKACLASPEAVGQVYNAAYGGRVTLLELYNKLSKLLGKNIQPNFGPERIGDIKHSNADISKARNLLGYDPQFDFHQGIELAVDWYRENLPR